MTPFYMSNVRRCSDCRAAVEDQNTHECAEGDMRRLRERVEKLEGEVTALRADLVSLLTKLGWST